VIGPSDEPYSDRLPTPKAMTLGQIEDVKKAFVASVKRAVAAGFDVIEIHNAHGYLLSSFVSPASNHRTDQYGGSFENRIRLTLEIVELTRKEIPDSMPLFLRITATDWLEQEPGLESWKGEDTVRLAEILADKGVDLLDVSSGGNHPKQKIDTKAHGGAYQAVSEPHQLRKWKASVADLLFLKPLAMAIKEKLSDKLLVGVVGGIKNGKQANDLLETDGLDLAIVGRMFQKNPGLVFSFADDLGVEVVMPNQISWGFGGRGKKAAKEAAKHRDGKI